MEQIQSIDPIAELRGRVYWGSTLYQQNYFDGAPIVRWTGNETQRAGGGLETVQCVCVCAREGVSIQKQ